MKHCQSLLLILRRIIFLFLVVFLLQLTWVVLSGSNKVVGKNKGQAHSEI